MRVAIAVILCVTMVGTTDYADAATDQEAVPAVIAKTTTSVVAIIGKPTDSKQAVDNNRYDLAHGTGVIIKSEGYILTNAHVVKNMRNIVVVTSEGKSYPGKTTHFDEESDLALVKIDATGLTPAVFAKPADVKVGEAVMAIGTPLSFALRNSVTYGIVSGMDRSVLSTYQLIQTDAAINPGNSGGALVNMRGQVIGINTLKYVQYGVDGLGFAIPVSTVQHVLEHFFKYGKVKRPSLGLELGESWEAVVGLPSSNGLEVTYVEPDSAGAKAGIKQADVLLSINGIITRNLVEYNEALKNYLPEEKVKLVLQSEGKTKEVELVLGEGKSDAAAVIQDVDGSYIDADQGKTQIGDSHFGWSMKYPAGLINQDQRSGEENNVYLSDAKGEFGINIVVEERQSEDLSKLGLMKKLAGDSGGTLLEKRYVEKKPDSYVLVVGKEETGEYYQLRAFLKGDKIYYLMLFVDKEENYTNALKRNSYNDLLDTFVLTFDANNPSIKDISGFNNTDTISTEYGLSFDVPAEWTKKDWGSGLYYANKDSEQTLSVEVSSASSGDTLKDWAARQLQTVAGSYVDSYKEINEAKDTTIGGVAAIESRYATTMGDKWRQYRVYYIFKDKYKYELKFAYPKTDEGEELNALVDTFTESVDFAKEGTNRSLGFIQDEEELVDKAKTITFTNKKYKYALHLPENWQGIFQRELDIATNTFSFNGGSLSIIADDRTSFEEMSKRLEQDHKKNAETDENYKYTISDESQLGPESLGKKFAVTYKSRNIPYTIVDYVFENQGIVYILRQRINDAVKTEEQWQRLEKAAQSFQLLDK
ncbi:trypsin-like serine protease [Paenibacillus sp. S3N08]|uniref:Trypsin-like serine protease n=2 Tax=Paenibacillus agricola TaxID=2716264 RepID=A0ABX0IY98_9BACL|nr:trypsin-like serine protease [Paenibacillus agricola]